MNDLIDYTDNYYKQPYENIEAAYRKRKVVELIERQKHNCILEVGCGLDPFFNYFKNFNKLVILEPSTPFYLNALDKISNDKNLSSTVIVLNEYFENSINQLKEFEFDYIIISCLLHEIENVALFFEKISCIVKENTIVHIDVPNAFSFHRVLALEMGLINSVFEMSENNIKFQQQKVYDLASLSNLVQQYNFKIINSGTYIIKPFTHKQMYELLEKKIIDSKVLDGFNRMIKYMPDLGAEIFIDFKIND
ncbi:MAG: class I SAM-dependent methyltransferase [Bacteroidales bacterium]|nr:class I SAM-dependent methyltransferase [Bacteroidales bacterium]MCF8390274.1 class I SAM-dependent methyltransferase [Bacteroidales bacterium]